MFRSSALMSQATDTPHLLNAPMYFSLQPYNYIGLETAKHATLFQAIYSSNELGHLEFAARRGGVAFSSS